MDERTVTAHLEITSGIVRVFEGGEFGSPFRFAVAIVADEGCAIIKALTLPQDVKLSKQHWNAIGAELRRAGFTSVRWRRRRGGRVREIVISDS